MSLKKIIRESLKSWDSETRSVSKRDKRQHKFAGLLLKKRHNELVEFNNSREDGYIGGYPNDFDEFMLLLKNSFPSYDGFGHVLQTTVGSRDLEKLFVGMDEKVVIKLISEYILNYGEGDTHERVDIVADNEIFDYIDAQFFDCSDTFFENVWDDLLSGKSNYWNEDLKDNMWSEIESEVVEKMEDTEWQEENGMEFDDVENLEIERDYFMSYWYYPIHSLGWDKITLCEWYKEFINQDDLQKHFFNPKEQHNKSNEIWNKLPIGDSVVYIINRNKLF